MFTLSDGREHLYQWDLDRQVSVQDPSVTEVHFCNRTDECSLVTKVVNGLADIPNILLQSSFDIRVFGYDGKATRFDKVFKVKARTRPADYIYTETEVFKIEEYVSKLIDVNNYYTKAESDKKYAKNDSYLTTREFDEWEHNFASEIHSTFIDEEELNKALEGIEGGNVDLTNYYTKEEADNKFAEGPRTGRYITSDDFYEWEQDFAMAMHDVFIDESELNKALEGIEGGNVDLTGYATENYVNTAIANIEIPEAPDLTDYVTESEVNNLINAALGVIENGTY